MRLDLREDLKTMSKLQRDKLNVKKYCELNNTTPKTVKKIKKEIDDFIDGNSKKVRKTKILTFNDYKDKIIEFRGIGHKLIAIHEFILHDLERKGLDTSKYLYETLKKFVQANKIYKNESKVVPLQQMVKLPGQSFQVDWKENKSIILKDGTKETINILKVASAYSGLYFHWVTFDKRIDTLLKGLIKAFEFFGGVPTELVFDNMKTVVIKVTPKGKILNEKMIAFAKNFRFIIRTCDVRAPQQKGVVEAKMKFSDRDSALQGSFLTADEHINHLNKMLNRTKVWNEKHDTEQKHLKELPSNLIMDKYKYLSGTRIVDGGAHIHYMNCKFLVDLKYVGASLDIVHKENIIQIYSNDIEIESFEIISDKYLYASKDNVVKIIDQYPAFKTMKKEDYEYWIDYYFKNYNGENNEPNVKY